MTNSDPILHVFQCDGAEVSYPELADGTVTMYQIRSRGDTGEIDLQMHELYRIVLGRVCDRHADLIRIAAYVYRADLSVSRGGEQDSDARSWKRRLHLCIPVSEPEFWNQPDVMASMEAALTVLTDDTWSFLFSSTQLGQSDIQQRLEAMDPYREPGAIVLFSGGMDSLCTLVEAAMNGERPVPMGHWANLRVSGIQKHLVRSWNAQHASLAVPLLGVPIVRRGSTPADMTQRSRGFLYGCMASAVAAETGAPRVYLSDNGPISLNLPINDQLVGAMASRGTHPRFLSRLNAFLRQVLDAPVTVSNPLQWKTRAEALEVLKASHVDHLVADTVSCSAGSRLPASTPHCGGCSQCIDRRMATIAAGLEAHDPASRYHQDLFLDVLDPWARSMTAYSYVRLARSWSTMTDRQILERYPQFLDILSSDGIDADQVLRDALYLMRRHTDTVMRVMTDQVRQHVDQLVAGTVPAGSLIGKIVGEQQGRRAPQATLRIVHATEDHSEAPISATVNPPPERSILEWTGSAWTVAYGGTTTSLPASINITRLAVLLREPNRRFSAEEIYAIAEGQFSNEQQTISFDELTGMMRTSTSRQDILDPEAIRSIRAAIAKLKKDAVSLREQGDIALAEETEAQAEVVQEHLEQATGLAGRSRAFSDSDRRKYQAVRRSLERGISKVELHHRPLFRHLHHAIHLESPFVYAPEPLLSWKVVLPAQAA